LVGLALETHRFLLSQKIMTGTHLSDSDRISGCQLMESLLLNGKGQLDEVRHFRCKADTQSKLTLPIALDRSRLPCVRVALSQRWRGKNQRIPRAPPGGRRQLLGL
jgi:hypothetical protein